eukprot:scaffold121447_cov64-Phaeocystis_antarctica.AAC.6
MSPPPQLSSSPPPLAQGRPCSAPTVPFCSRAVVSLCGSQRSRSTLPPPSLIIGARSCINEPMRVFTSCCFSAERCAVGGARSCLSSEEVYSSQTEAIERPT